jgi:hypothetical protein
LKRIQKSLSFSNVVALLALFVALGGSAYAATQLPKNSIGPKQLKKNAVTASKIAKGAVTGAKINLKTLGTVPAATNAVHATNADHATAADTANTAKTATSATTATTATNAANATNASAVNGLLIFPTERVNANANLASSQKIELGSRGPFNFYARCYDEGAKTEAVEYIEVTSGNASFGTEGSDSLESLTPATPEEEREINSSTANTNSINENGTDSDFRAASTDVAITGNIGLAMAKNGAPATGDGPFLPGDSCIFGGVIFG